MAVHKYVYDLDLVLQETDSFGNLLTEYTSTGEVFGDMLSAYDGKETRFLEYDALGSSTALADESQVVTDRWQYQAYGSATQSLGTTVNAFTWVGRQGYYYDSEVDLYSLRMRHFDPHTAAFLSRDPADFASGDTNLYRYVRNRPLDMTDPFGLFPFDTCRRTAKYIGVCGADVTKKIEAMDGELDKAFAAVANQPGGGLVWVYQNCQRIHHAQTGWDVEEIHHLDDYPLKRKRFKVEGCGTGLCDEMVTVNGKCFEAKYVNYFLWGRLNRKCHDLQQSATKKELRRMAIGRGESMVAEYELTFPDGSWIREIGPAELGKFDHDSMLWFIQLYRWVGYHIGIPGAGGRVDLRHYEYEERAEWAEAGWNNDLSKVGPKSANPYCIACTVEYNGTFNLIMGRKPGGAWFRHEY